MGAIERLIQQKQFKNEHEKAIVGLLYSANFVTSSQQDAFKNFGITHQQFNALRILRGQYPNPAHLNLIKDRLIDRNSDVSRLIERLRVSEFVERVTCPNDRRSVDVKITEKGLMILAEIDKANETLFTSELMPLSQKEVIEFNALLDKLLTAYEQQLKVA